VTVPTVRLIVPVLNDTEKLRGLLAALSERDRVETVVVDGGSNNEALKQLRRDYPWVHWRSSPPGRGIQMNLGAEGATSDWLLFLHADVRLPYDWMKEVGLAADASDVVLGCFRFTVDATGPEARRLERLVAWRVRWLSLPYGDQALFVRRSTFEAIGGYRDWPLMEDVDLVRRLTRRGRLWCSNRPVLISARRWHREGWRRRSAKNVALLSLFFLGVPPRWIARLYYGPRW
jgi:rSAM/selenodomain-associated transferase 2